MFESRHHSELIDLCIVSGLGLGWRDIADGLEKPSVIEPVDPFQGGDFHGLHAAPRTAPVDEFGLVEAVDRLGQGIVVAVTDAAYRWLDPGLGQTLGIAD